MRFSARPARLSNLTIMRELLARSEAQANRRRTPVLLRLRRFIGWALALTGLPLLLAHAYAQKIVTVAGNGTAGYVAAQDGGPATRAQLDEPYGTAVDARGNLYIAERASHRIRRVDAATGTITTVAGNGEAGYRPADEGAPAIQAQLNGPRAVAVDALSNLYIADTGNHRIRKVDRAGHITTLAGTGTPGFRMADEGGPATAAQLDSPRAVAVDRLGNVFLSDYNNQRVRKITAATQTIRTVAGTGTAGYLAAQGGGPAAEAELNNPYGIVLDADGNLYIADAGNHRVRRVEAHTGIITTVAGNGTSGYRLTDEGKLATRATLSTPCALAVDSKGNFYIADLDDQRIRRVDATTGDITTIAGAGVPGYITTQDGEAASIARVNKPRGLAVDSLGALYIADSANNRIRKVEPVKTGIDLAVK